MYAIFQALCQWKSTENQLSIIWPNSTASLEILHTYTENAINKYQFRYFETESMFAV